MQELEVQKYLKSGKSLDDLKEELGIKYNAYDNLVVLNYHQCDSPKAHPIVIECRSLILELNTWDVVYMAFNRFFNKGEMLEQTSDFNFANAVAQEKIDGSIIGVFYYNNRWYMTTRGCIEGTGGLMITNMTFKDLFIKIVGNEDNFYNRLNKQLNYTFELVSMESKVVKVYLERALYLLGARNIKDFNEISYDNLKLEYERIKTDFIKMPKVYPFNDFSELIQLHKGMNATDEGFVTVDYTKQVNGCFPRLKVKNPAYIALAHMKESSGASARCLMQLVILGEEKEFLTYFPEFSNAFFDIKNKYDKYIKQMDEDVELVREELIKKEDKRAFAIKIKNSNHKPYLFALYDGNCENYRDFVDKYVAIKGMKIFAKKMLSTLKITDLNYEA